jgi:hypothetical protein
LRNSRGTDADFRLYLINGSGFADFNAFKATGTGIGIFDFCVFVDKNIYFAENMFGAFLNAFPAGIAFLFIQKYVRGTHHFWGDHFMRNCNPLPKV